MYRAGEGEKVLNQKCQLAPFLIMDENIEKEFS